MQLPRRWEKVDSKGQIYSPRTGHAVCVNNQKLYLFGGADALSRCNDCYQYDFTTKVWRLLETKNEKPIERSGAKAEVHNGHIYFFGGYTKKDGQYFDDIFSLNLSTLNWQGYDVTQVPDSRTDHSLVMYKDALYAYGGRIEVMIRRDLIKFDIRTKQWSRVGSSTLNQMPGARFGHTAVVNDNLMYIFGGWDGHLTLNHLLIFDLNSYKWIQGVTNGEIPARYRHSAVTTPDAMYVFGGIDHTQQRFNDIYEFNYKSRNWSVLATIGDAPSKRTFHSAAFYQGFMYIMGGFDGIKRNDVYRILVDQKFCPKNAPLGPNEIQAEPGLTDQHQLTNEYFNNIMLQHWYRLENHGKVFTGRTGHQAFIWKKNIYVFGGTDDNAKLSDLYVYGVYKNEWEKLTTTGSPPCPRSGSKGVSYKNGLYLFGGYQKKHGIYYNDIYKYDIAKNEWAQISTQGNKPAPRTDHTCILYQNNIYIFGGYDGLRRFNDLYKFDLETSEWSKIEGDGDVPGDRFGHTAVLYDHSMYIFGGWNGHQTLNDIYQYSFASNYWFWLRRIRGDQPASRYRHAAVVLNDKMYLFGGVDTNQTRYNDLIQYQFASRHWKIVQTSGAQPIPRTFHRAVIYKDILYIIGGYGGKRLNDMHHIALPYDDFTEEESESVLNTKRPGTSSCSLFSQNIVTRDRRECENEQRCWKVIAACLFINETSERAVAKTQNRGVKRSLQETAQICYEKQIDVAFLECGHCVTCSRCSSNLKNCPVCRHAIARIVKTFSI